ncbi:MAG: hypothetical protein ACR2M6_03460 [Vampirovibrionia bacterium]
MENLDLNFDNYSLEEILNLLNLSVNFGENELKIAKRTVLMTHPDKSGLKPEIFLFFSKAYKYVYFIHQFRHRNDKTIREDLDGDESHSEIIAKIREKKDFHKVFNELFEEHKMRDEFRENGYEDWLSSDQGLSDSSNNVRNMADMKNAFFEEKRKKMELIKYNGVEDVHDSSHYDLTGSAPDNYSSSLFSNLQYEDVKVAHSENIIPVSEQDYDPSKQFQSVMQLQQFRGTQDMAPLADAQATQYLENKQKLDDRESTRRAFLLAKQMEEAQKKNEQFIAKFKYLQ